jgi:hypothetical protein
MKIFVKIVIVLLLVVALVVAVFYISKYRAIKAAKEYLAGKYTQEMCFVSAHRGVIGGEAGHWIVYFAPMDNGIRFQVRIYAFYFWNLDPLVDFEKDGKLYTQDSYLSKKFASSFDEDLENIAATTIDDFVKPTYTCDDIIGDNVMVSAHQFTYYTGVNEDMSVLEMEPYMLYDIRVWINIQHKKVDIEGLAASAFRFIEALRENGFSPKEIKFNYETFSHDDSDDFYYTSVDIDDWQTVNLEELEALFEDSFD